jgi:cell division transport system permease protein
MIRHLRAYFSNHLHAFSFSCKQLLGKPVASLMTIAMLGVAFSLPACLWVILTNAKSVTQGWQHTTQMSLFLDKSLSRESERNTLKIVRAYQGVQFANFISPKQGLQTLEEQTGMTDVSALLDKNPLPAVIEVHPEDIQSVALKKLFESLKNIEGVSFAKIDMQWLERLDSMIKIAEHLSSALQLLFGLAVLLVVGNTIRLAVQNRHKEIEVLKLIGATNQFIRRPFLYFGLIYGFLGALAAWLVVNALVGWVSDATEHLAKLYHTDFHLQTLGVTYGFSLLGMGLLLGFLGARLAVSRQIKAFEPK